MSVRIRYRLDIGISSTPAEDKDLGNGIIEVVNDDQDDGGAWKFKLASGATDVLAQLGNLSEVDLLIIRTSVHDPTMQAGNVQVALGNVNVAGSVYGPGTVSGSVFTPTTPPSWTVNAYIGDLFEDVNENRFPIVSNTSTTLTVFGTPFQGVNSESDILTPGYENQPITITPLAIYNPKEGLMVLTTDGATDVYLSNPSAVDMDVTVYAAGN